MFFKKQKKQEETATAGYREFLSKAENRIAVHNISQKLLAEIAPDEAEITAGFIDPLIAKAAEGGTLATDALDEAGGFGGADLMVVVAVQVAIVVIDKLVTGTGERDVASLKRRLRSEQNPEAFVRIETNDVKVAITSTQSSQGERKVRQIIKAVNLILLETLLGDAEELQNAEETSGVKKISLSHNDKQGLIAELNKLPQWQTGGVNGERAVLLAAGLPQKTVYAFSLSGVPSTDAINVISSLENIGQLVNRPSHTALGALAAYLLENAPDKEGQNFLTSLIVRYAPDDLER